MNKKISRAFISVSDKTGLIQLAKKLVEQEVEIIASDGTAAHLKASGIATKSVEQITGFAQVLDGRVKTLHPNIHAAILADIDQSSHLADLRTLGIMPIDLVVINFYDASKFDIGGPAAVRAGVKNSKHVALLTDPAQYLEFIEKLAQGFDQSQRDSWAKAALLKVANYDLAILSKLGQPLRYGENPHQKGYFFGDLEAMFDKIHGKELSYNNLLDIDAAVNLMEEFRGEAPTFAILKHNNACGFAQRITIKEAYVDALAGDPVSAFGGILIANTTIDAATAKEINDLFCEVVIAPNYTEDALEIIQTKKNRIILVQKEVKLPTQLVRTSLNGLLVQDKDFITDAKEHLTFVTNTKPSEPEIEDLLFASKLCKNTKSNTIVLVKNKQLLASGTGQTSRVDALNQAIEKAKNFGFDLNGAAMASDAFFPFPDCVEIADKAGIKSVIQPGGSIKDQLSVDYCNAHNLSMVTSGIRHFKH